MLQILANLTRNAALHGDPRGPIRIELDGRSSETVLVVVHNHGHIPPERLGRLFDPFKRAVDRYRRGDGLGLGLYIVDQLVRAHGGRVQVDSQPSTGTRFLVDLPRSAG
jgi:two-component system, sensor histidine kinase and response regulator